MKGKPAVANYARTEEMLSMYSLSRLSKCLSVKRLALTSNGVLR
jgi:hypothetical protein